MSRKNRQSVNQFPLLQQALYNKKQYALALNQLAEAEKHQKSRAMAQQWKQFVQGEKRQADAIAAELGTS